MFNNLKDDLAIEENRAGGGFAPFEQDIYTGTVKMAYGDAFDSGSQFIQLTLEMEDGREYNERLIVTNREGKNYYVRDNVERGLPGFTVANDICLSVAGLPLSQVQGEEKSVLVYDYDLKKKVPQRKYVLTPIIGGTVSVAISKNIKNKQKKVGNEYVDINEEMVENTIHTVFHTESRFTTTEARNNATEAAFWDLWLDKNKGKERNTYKEVAEGGSSGGSMFGGNTGGAAQAVNPFTKK